MMLWNFKVNKKHIMFAPHLSRGIRALLLKGFMGLPQINIIHFDCVQRTFFQCLIRIKSVLSIQKMFQNKTTKPNTFLLNSQKESLLNKYMFQSEKQGHWNWSTKWASTYHQNFRFKASKGIGI